MLGLFQNISRANCIDTAIEDEYISHCEETENIFFGNTVGETIADFLQGGGIHFRSLDDNYKFTNFQDLDVRKLGKKIASYVIEFLDGVFEDEYGTTTLGKFPPKVLSKKKAMFCDGFDDSVHVANEQFVVNGSMDLLEMKPAPKEEDGKNQLAEITVGTEISEFLWGISYHMIEYYDFCDFEALNLRDFGAKVGKGLISFLHKHGSSYGDPRKLLLGLYEKRAEFCWGIDDAIIEARNKEWQESGFDELLQFMSDNNAKKTKSHSFENIGNTV